MDLTTPEKPPTLPPGAQHAQLFGGRHDGAVIAVPVPAPPILQRQSGGTYHLRPEPDREGRPAYVLSSPTFTA